MAYIKNGPLSRYFKLEVPPRYLVAQWIFTLAKTVHYVHIRCVILGDIASRNVLLADDMSVKLCDFTDSAIITLDCDMSSAEQDGITI
jgi:serine/threonine protein kinase